MIFNIALINVLFENYKKNYNKISLHSRYFNLAKNFLKEGILKFKLLKNFNIP